MGDSECSIGFPITRYFFIDLKNNYVSVGKIEKMSKSKKNVIDPGVTLDVAKVNAEIIIDSFNEMGCDAFSLGSKDFSGGLDFVLSQYKKSGFNKNNFFRSTIPLGLFNYGGIVAVQTLWAGPWMVRVAGYTPLESATGLFWINVTMLFAFFVFGYILPKITKLGIESIKLIKL